VRRVEYELMTPAEVVENRERCPVIFVPISPIEWHGPHLPLGTDGLHAHHVAVRAAPAFGGVVFPTVYAGTETVRPPGGGPQSLGAIGFGDGERIVGMDFPANPVKSVYFEESAFGIAVREVARQLKRDPFGVIALVNGHGASTTSGRCGGSRSRRPTRPARASSTALSSPSGGRPKARPPTPTRARGQGRDGDHARARGGIHSPLRSPRGRRAAPLPGFQDHRRRRVRRRSGAGLPPARGARPVAGDPWRATRAEGERMIEDEVQTVLAVVRDALERRVPAATRER
jgi:creatinine amidohydrolase/Fe(II)-dependent formamide hydrolase-like protein